MNIECEHINHGCEHNTFIWINYSEKMIYLEIPKNASSYMKHILNDKSWKNLEKQK